ncbi:hypothetical protein H0H81_008959 [Sphagnurus paluster]|uniref:Uncharacterized protein n=1 Tax=Sphagnurus paluster TaxID=117069 RepID=A0A9P7FXH1_9AGAR|nr:hypothetical protein H0H81_008959 [Sphagnurus paluster]
MKLFVLAASLVSIAPSILALTINTPTNVVECQPILLTWDGGKPPYFVSAIPGGQPAAQAIKSFPTQNGNSFTWIVDLQAGTSISLSLKDSTGEQAYSDIVQIQPGSDSSCVNTSVAVSGTGGTAASTAGNTAASSSGAATTGASSTKPSETSKGSASSTGTSSGSSSTNSNAASKSSAGVYGLAGIMGLVGLAVL